MQISVGESLSDDRRFLQSFVNTSCGPQMVVNIHPLFHSVDSFLSYLSISKSPISGFK
jgi:hypothetical protein